MTSLVFTITSVKFTVDILAVAAVAVALAAAAAAAMAPIASALVATYASLRQGVAAFAMSRNNEPCDTH